MRRREAAVISIILIAQLAAISSVYSAHSATIQWDKSLRDGPTYPFMPNSTNMYYWNGTFAKWINFTVTNKGPDVIKEIKIVFQKYDNGSSMFQFNQTWQNKTGWYATPDEFGPDKRPTVLYFRTDTPSQYINVGETVSFSLFMTKGPEECKHNIDVWTVDAGTNPSTNFFELFILIDQHYPSVDKPTPVSGTVIDGSKSPSVTVKVNARDLEGPHQSGIKNATLHIHYNVSDVIYDPPDRDFTMKYNATDKTYYYTLTDALGQGGLVNEAWHECRVTVFDYAENGPVSNTTTFFWFIPDSATVKAYTTDPCFLYKQLVNIPPYGLVGYGHVGGNAKVNASTGFEPNEMVSATLGGIPIGSGQANTWGQFTLDFTIPELPRKYNTLSPGTTLPYQIVLTGASGIKENCNFTIIPWMGSASINKGDVGSTLSVRGTGFAANAKVNVFYRDVSFGAYWGLNNDVWAMEWSDNATQLWWRPYLGNLTVSPSGGITTSASGTFNLTFTIPESYGGYHPIFGREVLTGVRSGWIDAQHNFPEAAFFYVNTSVSTLPTTGLTGQYVQVTATGLPLPEYHSYTYDCRTKQNKTYSHEKMFVLDFGPNKYWVFEKGFILNNEFDYGWWSKVYLPFAYWYNHDDPHAPTWNGTLYWKDANAEFHVGSQFLKVPALAPGNYLIKLYQFDLLTEADELHYSDSTSFTVVKDPLYVRVTSGTLYFKSEKVTTYAEVDLDGTATNPTDVSFAVYYEDQFLMNLTPEPVSEGLYFASFTCPENKGNYLIKVNATKELEGITLRGFGTAHFVVSTTLDGFNATLTAFKDGLATINTSMGTIILSLNEVKGNLTSIRGNVATIITDIGTLKTDISTIEAKLVGLEGSVATIQTDIGTIKTSLESINTQVTAIGADTVIIKTAVGDVQGRIVSVQNKTASIETSIGQVTTAADSIKSQGGLQSTGIALSLIAALAAIIAAVLIFRKLYK
jgi:hypothetical protein